MDATPDEINASLQPGLRNKVSVETGKGAPSVVVRYSYLEGLVTIK
ncbi:MAG: hypothetical protein HY519_04070 [Candidatus Aenigmarchaeota archaeon]|nr:hypothetical protein [Candidatus Aenigmarchaeota archaeon]